MKREEAFRVFETEIARRKQRVQELLGSRDYPDRFRPPDIHEAVHSYLKLGGKSLRAGVLLFSCGAVGGNEDWALPAAAAIEVYHAWTLVHDDLIDQDDRRRGGPTIHRRFFEKARKTLKFSVPEALHYGQSVAVLAGDLQQGWTVSLLVELSQDSGLSPRGVLEIINDLELNVQSALIEGETLDVLYSRMPATSVSEADILRMLDLKTGALYGFAGRAGAMIGLRSGSIQESRVQALSTFARLCGTAFQIADDILGAVGDERKLGKPVGSDIRSGKKTILVHYALGRARGKERSLILKTLGSARASVADVKRVTQVLVDVGAIDHAHKVAAEYVRKARTHLRTIPSSPYRDLLQTWAEYVTRREF